MSSTKDCNKFKVLATLFLIFVVFCPMLFACGQGIYLNCATNTLECVQFDCINLDDLQIETNANREELKYFVANSAIAKIEGDQLTCVGVGRTVLEINHYQSNTKLSINLLIREKTNEEIFEENKGYSSTDNNDASIDNNQSNENNLNEDKEENNFDNSEIEDNDGITDNNVDGDNNSDNNENVENGDIEGEDIDNSKESDISGRNDEGQDDITGNNEQGQVDEGNSGQNLDDEINNVLDNAIVKGDFSLTISEFTVKDKGSNIMFSFKVLKNEENYCNVEVDLENADLGAISCYNNSVFVVIPKDTTNRLLIKDKENNSYMIISLGV